MFETLTAALVITVFLVPGFVWRTVEGQFVYLDRRLQWEKFALGLVARSTVVYAIFAAKLYQLWKADWFEQNPWGATFVGVCLVGALPGIFGLVSGIIRQVELIPNLIRKAGLRTFEQHQIPTAWDYIFSSITPRWVAVTLTDGSKLYGYLGPDSYFSSDPESRDMFISKALRVTSEGIMQAVPKSAGVYISKDQVAVIEFTEA